MGIGRGVVRDGVESKCTRKSLTEVGKRGGRNACGDDTQLGISDDKVHTMRGATEYFSVNRYTCTKCGRCT